MINRASHTVRFRTWFLVGAATAGLALALSAHRSGVTVIAATASQQAAGATANDFEIPSGYRDWRLISVAILGTPFNDIRAKLGNDLAISTFREKEFPFPDGAMIARLAWKQVQSEVNNNAFRQDPSADHLSPVRFRNCSIHCSAAGPPTNVQVYDQGLKEIRLDWRLGASSYLKNGRSDHVVEGRCFVCHAQKELPTLFAPVTRLDVEGWANLRPPTSRGKRQRRHRDARS